MKQYCKACGQEIREARTTGPHSQNSYIHGNCSAIAFQENERKGKVWCTPSMVYDIMKRFAVSEGVYPGVEYKKGKIRLIEPMSQSLVSKEDDDGLIKVINQYADEQDFWLWAYTPDKKNKYKSKQGRTLSEMMKYEPELNREIWESLIVKNQKSRKAIQKELEIF